MAISKLSLLLLLVCGVVLMMSSNEVDAVGVCKFLCLNSEYMTCKKTKDEQLKPPTCGATGSDCCPVGCTLHFSDGTVRVCKRGAY